MVAKNNIGAGITMKVIGAEATQNHIDTTIAMNRVIAAVQESGRLNPDDVTGCLNTLRTVRRASAGS